MRWWNTRELDVFNVQEFPVQDVGYTIIFFFDLYANCIVGNRFKFNVQGVGKLLSTTAFICVVRTIDYVDGLPYQTAQPKWWAS